MVAVHGEELVEAYPLTAVLESHDSYIVDDHVRIGLDVHFFYALWHGAVVFKVLLTLPSVSLRGCVGDDHHSFGLDNVQESP